MPSRYAGAITPSDDPERVAVWGLIKYDLDWLAQGDPTVGLNGCDLWEETTDPNFLWNRVTQRRALVWGTSTSTSSGTTFFEKEFSARRRRALRSMSIHPVHQVVAGGGEMRACRLGPGRVAVSAAWEERSMGGEEREGGTVATARRWRKGGARWSGPRRTVG